MKLRTYLYKTYCLKLFILQLFLLMLGVNMAEGFSTSDFVVLSPDGQISATVKFDVENGALYYMVKSRNQGII